MRLFQRSTRIILALAVLVLAACGDVGDTGAPTGSASAGSGGSNPKIQGIPGSAVAAGQAYSFQPVVSGSSGSHTYSALNLPAWLALNASTGRVTGTPSDADIGTYTGITIVVSDGSTSARLGPFTITVAAMGSGTASLSWLPPTQNSDGSALLDLGGFIVLYGSSPTELTQTIAINNPSVTRYVVENLTSGTWYFSIQAWNLGGARSESSSPVSKTIS